MWWPYWKQSHWRALATGRTLSAGQHTIVITGGVPGSVFYGFRVCKQLFAGVFGGQRQLFSQTAPL
jgi:hypothetical protein